MNCWVYIVNWVKLNQLEPGTTLQLQPSFIWDVYPSNIKMETGITEMDMAQNVVPLPTIYVLVLFGSCSDLKPSQVGNPLSP